MAAMRGRIHREVTALSQWLHLLVSFFQIGSITGAILIVLIAVVGGILYQSAWIIDPKLWIIGTIFPVAGYSLGFFLARIAGQPWHRYGVLVNWTRNSTCQLCLSLLRAVRGISPRPLSPTCQWPSFPCVSSHCLPSMHVFVIRFPLFTRTNLCKSPRKKILPASLLLKFFWTIPHRRQFELHHCPASLFSKQRNLNKST